MPQDYEVRSYSNSAGSSDYGGGRPRNEKTSNENKVGHCSVSVKDDK